MNLANEHKAIIAALDNYRHLLDQIPDEQFNVTPPLGGWSYAEVYSHIMQVSLASYVAAERCCNKTGVSTAKGLNWTGAMVFLLGRFPGKRKTPETVANLTKNITKEEARNLIIKMRKRLDDIWPTVYNAPNDYKISHPSLGMLNAKQWLKFIRIHLQHHVKQLNRIKNSFPQG
ncbi:DinB family protein [Mucilaginibacter terrae]|uniref:DinB-like domain-containing protein n=1 Tax=Mucilaginibacter terrae TaxID=1955052 RepID=A0ABU3GTC9_9SPHI|nr:DinB family protein [Mucilaginibacter terrae]MDT3403038.1 hypothetical protein [Mucilaginibacter terrae]